MRKKSLISCCRSIRITSTLLFTCWRRQDLPRHNCYQSLHLPRGDYHLPRKSHLSSPLTFYRPASFLLTYCRCCFPCLAWNLWLERFTDGWRETGNAISSTHGGNVYKVADGLAKRSLTLKKEFWLDAFAKKSLKKEFRQGSAAGIVQRD